MRETGALHQIMKEYEPDLPNCEDDTGRPLGFNNCITAFLVPISGMILAMILFLFEYISVACGIKLSILEWQGGQMEVKEPPTLATPEEAIPQNQENRTSRSTPPMIVQDIETISTLE